MPNILGKINNRLDTAKAMINELEGKAIEMTQNETQKKFLKSKNSISKLCYNFKGPNIQVNRNLESKELRTENIRRNNG